jgi:serine/threonine-protein phosphatase 4 regulatory subunit 4
MHRIKEELALAKSCHIRMLFLKLCDMSISLFSKDYFKQNFFAGFLYLASDSVVNVRLKMCSMLPRLKSLLCLPSDRNLLQQLEETVKNLLLKETDKDVLQSIQVS